MRSYCSILMFLFYFSLSSVAKCVAMAAPVDKKARAAQKFWEQRGAASVAEAMEKS